MQTILFALLLVWPYLSVYFMAIVVRIADSLLPAWIFHIFSIVLVLFTYLCIRKQTLFSAKKLAYRNLLAKIVHLPLFFYMWSGIVYEIISPYGFGWPIILLVLTQGLYFVFINIITMAIGAMYCGFALREAKKLGFISSVDQMLHVLLHFLPIADLISAIWVYNKCRMCPEIE